MKIECPKCRAQVKVNDTQERDSSPVIRCARCNNLFFLDDSSGEPVPLEADQTEAAGPLEDIYLSRRRQAKRYLVLVMALLVAVVGYQLVEAMRKSEALEQLRCTAAKTALKQLARAQEQYYIEANEYADSLSDLALYYRIRPSIIIEIVRADATSWAATAYHEKSSTGLVFDSAKGGLQLEGFLRSTEN